MYTTNFPPPQMTWPYRDAVSVTPNNDTDLARLTRGIMVGADGNVSVITQDGTTITLPALKAGVMYPIAVGRIRSTGTTATGILALY